MDDIVDIVWRIVKLLFWLAMIGLTCYLLVSCGKFIKEDADSMIPFEQYYAEQGIMGTHPLSVLNLKDGPIGNISGSAGYFLFMGAGSVEGQIQPGTSVQIEWIVPSGMTQNISLSYEMILWDFSDEYVSPSFEFNFTQDFLSDYVNKETEIINYNSVFERAEAITVHCTRTQYDHDVRETILDQE